MSEAIRELVEIARANGLTGELTTWSRADVWWFEEEMPEAVGRKGHANPDLQYFQQSATPHYRGDNGFLDEAAKVAISFNRND